MAANPKNAGSTSHCESHQGMRTATNPGAMTRKIALPIMAEVRRNIFQYSRVGQDFILGPISNRQTLLLQPNRPIGNRPQVGNLPYIAEQVYSLHETRKC